MEALDLIDIIERGEDSRHQFKTNITNPASLAAEMVAFANTEGGMIIIGVDKYANITGLETGDIERINQLISNTATNNVKNPINPITENVRVGDKLLITVHIEEGIDKPYMDNTGAIWVKSGSDKRRVTSKEELRRLFQSSDLVHADEVPVNGTTINDIDLERFKEFYIKEYEEDVDKLSISVTQLFQNLKLAKDNQLNLAGLLLFGAKPERFKPSFIIKAVSFYGNDAAGDKYRDTEDIKGNIKDQFYKSMVFLKTNLKYIQGEKGINIPGDLEIPLIALEELLVNAIIHRNYFINAPIRLFIFDDRIEIVSPGTIPNKLTIENIKSGISNIRNDILASFAAKKELPYKGIGTGIRRALKKYPNIDFVNDTDGEQFISIIKRPSI